MLYPAARLIGLPVTARDGAIGPLDDFLFDDERWVVRWVAVDTATWLGRAVLLPPSALRRPDLDGHRVPLELTRAQVESSPSSGTAAPLLRLLEQNPALHYDMPSAARLDSAEIERNAHLHSVHEVTGYYIRATDDEIGHIGDFLVEDGPWAIRYLVVDTRNWLPGKRVLISPYWITQIDWADSTVHIELSRGAIESSPDWNPGIPLQRGYEELLHRHYGRQGYWS